MEQWKRSVIFKATFAIIIIALFGALLLGTLISDIKLIRVSGNAMSPTLNPGDRVLISVDIKKINRGDVIVFHCPADQSKIFCMRVIGLPGENIEIQQGMVLINKQSLSESYLDPAFAEGKSSSMPADIPFGNYFVLGDNRLDSLDSRYWGTVPKDLIIGRATPLKYGAIRLRNLQPLSLLLNN